VVKYSVQMLHHHFCDTVHAHCRRLRLRVPEHLAANSPDLNPGDYLMWKSCNRWCTATKFQNWPTETHANQLFGAAKPARIRAINQLPKDLWWPSRSSVPMVNFVWT